MKKAEINVMTMTLIALILAGVMLVSCVNTVSKNPLLNKNAIDYSGKLTYLNEYVKTLQDPATVETTLNRSIGGSTNDIFLFFSKGSGPIYLEYTGSNPQDNGDFFFARPETPSCENKACICYSSNARFWSKIDTMPFISYSKLFMTKERAQPRLWEDSTMHCIESTNPDVMFLNSRGLDQNFINEEVSFIPMEIPVMLQSDITESEALAIFVEDKSVKGGGYSLSDSRNVERRVSLNQNYVWRGGVAIGGMGIPRTDKDRQKHILTLPVYYLTFEKIPGTNGVGICLQSKCLYPEAKIRVEAYESTIVVGNDLENGFTNLNNYFINNFNGCKVDCATKLTNEIALVFPNDGLNAGYQIKIMKKTDYVTEISLLHLDEVVNTISWASSIPTLAGQDETEISIVGKENDLLLIEGQKYAFESSIVNSKQVYNLKVS